jgi:phosphoglycerol transferase MdoB-like AlkP superfamily enzyme
MDKQNANNILYKLDSTAERIQKLASAGKLDPKVAHDMVVHIDTLADKIQLAAFGPESFASFKTKVAKVLQSDPDEKYMKTFDNPNKVIDSDADEPYMHKTDASFNAKAIDNYDQDRTVTVSERDEFTVRDLSEWADKTSKQPSWARGPAGKSTKQGSTAPRTAASKSWAS